MSNSEIITSEYIADTLFKLSSTQTTSLESVAKTLNAIKDSGTISETNLKLLTNCWRELDSLRELFILRIMNSLKRGDIIKS